MSEHIQLSILIPVYNAGNLVRPHIGLLTDYLKQQKIRYEILLRDDGSLDKSYGVLQDLGSLNGEVRIFQNQRNEGLGSTLKKLCADARGDVLLYCDIDLPYPLETIAVILKETEKYDIVVASRYVAPSASRVNWLRWLSSRIYHRLCWCLFGIPIYDIGSGLVAFNQKANRLIQVKADGFDYHVEFFTRAVHSQLTMKELAAPDSEHEQQHTFVIYWHGPAVLWNTIKLWMKLFHESRLS